MSFSTPSSTSNLRVTKAMLVATSTDYEHIDVVDDDKPSSLPEKSDNPEESDNGSNRRCADGDDVTTRSKRRRLAAAAMAGFFSAGLVAVGFDAEEVHVFSRIGTKGMTMTTTTAVNHTANKTTMADGNPFAGQHHHNQSANLMTSSTQSWTARPQGEIPIPPCHKHSILFLIYCGGTSGRADMEAIMQTWGKTLNRVLVLSNTPNDMPAAFTNNHNTSIKSWHISVFDLMKDGGKRPSRESWEESVKKMHDELQDDPSIEWVVRSDSDTWWNVPLLEERLQIRSCNMTNFPPEEPLAMGQFFPLVNFTWKREVSSRRSQVPDLSRSNGANAY